MSQETVELIVEAQDMSDAKDKESEEDLVVCDEPDIKEILFVLPDVPGAHDQDEIIIDDSDTADVEVSDAGDKEVEVEEDDPWKWQSKGLENFLSWLQDRLHNVPQHSGKSTAGCERAISYLETLNKEISKAMRSDINNVIDINAAEKARDEIENGLERLKERFDKLVQVKQKRNKKRADYQTDGLIKEGQKATHINGITITVPLFISRLARTLINGTVSGGHNIEEMFEKLSKKYKLSNRETGDLMLLLQDMGYPVRRDRGYDIDEEYDTTSSDNYDFAANYPG